MVYTAVMVTQDYSTSGDSEYSFGNRDREFRVDSAFYSSGANSMQLGGLSAASTLNSAAAARGLRRRIGDGLAPGGAIGSEAQCPAELPAKEGDVAPTAVTTASLDANEEEEEEQKPPPEILILDSPLGSEECAGLYFLVKHVHPNGYPLWKNEDGVHFLFSGTDGMLLIGDSEQERADFQCKEGIIASVVPHEGWMPHELGGGWQRDDGDDWIDDPAIVVRLPDVDEVASAGIDEGDQMPDNESDEGSEAESVVGDLPQRAATMLHLPDPAEFMGVKAARALTL